VTCRYTEIFFPHWLYSPLGPWPLIFQFYDNLQTVGTPWTSDQLVARPLLEHRKTQNKDILKVLTLVAMILLFSAMWGSLLCDIVTSIHCLLLKGYKR
jgi:hypothetical protein